MTDNGRYKELKTQLENPFVFGKDYPKDLTAALVLLKRFKSSGKGGGTSNNQVTAGVAMDNASNKLLEQYNCYDCGLQGNVVTDYPKIDNKTILELSGWTFKKMRARLEGLKALCQK